MTHCPHCGKKLSAAPVVARERELLGMVRRVTGRDFQVLPRGFKKTLTAFTVAQVEVALVNMMHDPWHGPRMKELKLGYLLRAETIDNFLTTQKPKSRIEQLLEEERAA